MASLQFSTRINILGHPQQGGKPTPFDRNMGTKFGARALDHLMKQINETFKPLTGKCDANTKETATLLGLIGREVVFSPLEKLASETDFEHRLPNNQWWLKIRPLLRILAKHRASYVQEAA
uniref:PFK domain-containing protein n=1 Tax=Globodera pallida TaxID=36090 RepID=A0A183CFV4_GLOPA